MSRQAPRRYRTAAGTPRRRARVRRASAGLSPIRAAAILVMLVAGGSIYGLAASPAFGFARLDVSGLSLTTEDAIRAQVRLAPGTNLVGLATGSIAARIRDLPAVGEARVSVGLPDALRVVVTERRPILIWAIGQRHFAVDGSGLLFADVSTDPTGVTAGVPVVDDGRASGAGLAVRSVLDPVDLDAAERLGSLTPSQVGSRAAALAVRVTDEQGFTISSGSGGWLAVFGFYGRDQRTPALIPGQVQLLGALLAGREDTVATVILADERDGTYLPKPSAKPGTTPTPSKAP